MNTALPRSNPPHPLRKWTTCLALASLGLSACITDSEGEKYDASLGFYDVDAQGAARVVRNDLTGTLKGMVQFAQSHVVDPSGNAAKNMPDVVSQRQAVVLFTPTEDVSDPVQLEVSVDGQLKARIDMAPPAQIDKSDFVDSFGRPSVLYTKRAWTARLPWDVVRKGLSLKIKAANALEGELPADRITFGAPAQLTVWGIRLGMLTTPPVNNQQLMLSNPALAGTDYFQTVPIAELTVASYEDMQVDRVMVGDGSIVTSASARNGDVYSGDLREDVGKAQFSIGINLANQGVTSSRLGSQSWNQVTTQFVYHHSAGNYANGRVEHGLSGGGGIGTLYDSTGNEWSHEIGHHFGMGHYPGCIHDKGDYFWSAHHADSGWGHIAHRKRFRSNLAFDSNDRDGLSVNGFENKQSFKGLYSYNADAMSGGSVLTQPMLSRYTHHTGYTAARIQTWVNRPWVDAASPTGYSRFDAATGQVVSATTAAPKPSRFGVPVFTLLGGYDPVRRVGVMYPAARANFGHVHDNLPAPSGNASVDACWVDVHNGQSTRSIAIASTRLDGGLANKLHLNVAQADAPLSATLNCRQSGVTSQLANIAFPRNLPAMAPAVVVGRAAGFEALAKQELPQWESGLMAVSGESEPMPSNETLLLTDSWRERSNQLSSAAQAVLARRDAFIKRVKDFDKWMSLQTIGLKRKDVATIEAMRKKISDNGWALDGIHAPRFKRITGEGGQCMALSLPDAAVPEAQPRVTVVPAASCADVPAQGWLMDARGAIRNALRPDECLTLTPSNQVTVRPCHTEAEHQTWTLTSGRMIQSLARPNVSLDIDRAKSEVIGYGSHGGSNQQWQGLVQHKRLPWIVYLSGTNTRSLYATEPVF